MKALYDPDKDVLTLMPEAPEDWAVLRNIHRRHLGDPIYDINFDQFDPRAPGCEVRVEWPRWRSRTVGLRKG